MCLSARPEARRRSASQDQAVGVRRAGLLVRQIAGLQGEGRVRDLHTGIVKSGPIRISLYEVQRDSSEASANRGYYDRFPADTDWAAVAREYHEAHSSDGLAAHGGAQYGTS